jgi:hypothetical protein
MTEAAERKEEESRVVYKSEDDLTGSRRLWRSGDGGRRSAA